MRVCGIVKTIIPGNSRGNSFHVYYEGYKTHFVTNPSLHTLRADVLFVVDFSK